jgi:O-antigen ligase
MYHFLIGLLLFLTSATGLLFSGIRTSDISLGIILCFSIFEILRKKSNFLLNTNNNYTFFIILLTSIFFSIFFNLVSLLGNQSSNDYITLPFSIFSAMMISFSYSEIDLKKIVIKYIKVTIFLLICLYVLYEFNLYELELDLLLESNERFSGFSKNPNQLALYLLPIPFFALHFYRISEIKIGTMIWFIFGVVLINFFVIGKALFISWTVGIVLIYILTGVTSLKRKISFKYKYLRLIFMLTIIPVFTKLIENLYSGNISGGQEGQGEIRILLWNNGLRAAFDALFFGHGPGHYSGIFSPYEQMEAHNFYIDWFSAYGLVGLFCYLLLIGNILILTVRSRNIVIFALVIALLFQIMFHFYGRQPFFWLTLIIALRFGQPTIKGNK